MDVRDGAAQWFELPMKYKLYITHLAMLKGTPRPMSADRWYS